MHKYTHHLVTCKGKKDGRNWKYSFWPFRTEKPVEPKPEQEMPPQFETEIVKAAENDVAKDAEKWKELDQKLKPKYCQAVAVLDNARKKHLKESEEADLAKTEFDAAKTKYEELTMPALDAKWRNLWLIFIAIAEFPLNSIVFGILGSGRLETYIISAGLCVAIPLIAHFFGQSIRQENKNSTDIILMITMPVTILLILGAIAFIRAKYFEAMIHQDLIGISITPTQMTILFIIINMAIFLVAVMVSYEGSHPDKKYFKTITGRYKEAMKRLQKEATEATEAGAELARAEQNFQQVRQHRLKSHEKFIQAIKTIVDGGEWLVSSYRAANLRVRKDIPQCFKQQPQSPAIAEELLKLDWECNGQAGGKSE